MIKVITYGSFDLFHEGHYNLLKRAKELGDYLIVGITTEQYDEARGKMNVVDSLITRIDNVRATGFVDEIVIEDHVGQKLEDIQRYGIDIFTVGSDWVGKFDYLEKYCKVVYLERTKDVSSTLRRDEKHGIIKIGIVGSGRIAKRFPSEVKFVSGIQVYGVYNPHIDSAKNFAEEHQLAFYSGNYEEFLDKVDAVYVASPHETHYEYAKKALSVGKHVLCEKPMVFSKEKAEELFDIAKKNKCILMEAIKTAYCPGFNQLLTVAQSGAIGKIVDVEAAFTRITEPGLRELTDINYGGSFTEFGSYTVLPIIKLLGTNFKEVRFDSIKAENGIDAYTKAYFKYDNAMGLSKTGVLAKSEGQLIVAGTDGYILAKAPWWLTQTFEVHHEDASQVETYSSKFLGAGIRYEVSDFVKAINNGENRKENYKLTSEESVTMSYIYEKFMKK